MPSINKLLKYPLLLSHRDKDQRTKAANSVQNRLHLYILPITQDLSERSEIFLGPRRASLSVALIILNFVTTSTNISELTTERIRFFDQNHAET